MILNPFEYHSPGTLEEALALAEKYGEDSKFLAGGQSLLPTMKLGLLSPAHIIDLGRLKSLEYIRKDDGIVAIGALTRMADIEASETLRQACPAFTDCASHIADPLVRNMGTIGGNACHADPANDIPAVVVAVSAEMVIAGPQGERRVSASQFFLDTFTTALQKGELLKEVRVTTEGCAGSAYAKLERQAGDFGIVGAAVRLWLSGTGAVRESGIALSGVGATVVQAKRAAESLQGKTPEPKTLAAAAQLAADDTTPMGDLRGPADYKREMAAVMTRRALSQALKRAKRASR